MLMPGSLLQNPDSFSLTDFIHDCLPSNIVRKEKKRCSSNGGSQTKAFVVVYGIIAFGDKVSAIYKVSTAR